MMDIKLLSTYKFSAEDMKEMEKLGVRALVFDTGEDLTKSDEVENADAIISLVTGSFCISLITACLTSFSMAISYKALPPILAIIAFISFLFAVIFLGI